MHIEKKQTNWNACTHANIYIYSFLHQHPLYSEIKFWRGQHQFIFQRMQKKKAFVSPAWLPIIEWFYAKLNTMYSRKKETNVATMQSGGHNNNKTKQRKLLKKKRNKKLTNRKNKRKYNTFTLCAHYTANL